jgi:hypothetical protein
VVKIDTSITLTVGAAGTVKLFCDASTQTTEVERVASSSTGTLTVGLNLASSNTLVMMYPVSVGESCKLTTTNDTGTPVFTLVSQRVRIRG